MLQPYGWPLATQLVANQRPYGWPKRPFGSAIFVLFGQKITKKVGCDTDPDPDTCPWRGKKSWDIVSFIAQCWFLCKSNLKRMPPLNLSRQFHPPKDKARPSGRQCTQSPHFVLKLNYLEFLHQIQPLKIETICMKNCDLCSWTWPILIYSIDSTYMSLRFETKKNIELIGKWRWFDLLSECHPF